MGSSGPRWLALLTLSVMSVLLSVPAGGGPLVAVRLVVALALAGTAVSLWRTARGSAAARDLASTDDPASAAGEPRAVLFQCIEDVRASVEPIANARGVGLQIEYVTKMPVTVGLAPGPLRQALREILRGALHATRQGNVLVLVYCWREDGELRLEIAVMDGGSGFAPEDLHKMFDRWESVDEDDDLARIESARDAMEALNGRMQLRHWPGIGTVCLLEAPAGPDRDVVFFDPPRRADPLAARGGPAPITREGGPDLADRRVLVVSGASVTRRILRDLLTQWGGAVQECRFAEEAVERFRSGSWTAEWFHLLLVEVDLAGTDGFQLVGQLRRIGVRHPVVAVTAAGGARDTYVSAGFDDWVPRPIDPDVLAEVLSGVLEGTQMTPAPVTRSEGPPGDSR